MPAPPLFNPTDPAFWRKESVAKAIFTPQRKTAAVREAAQMIGLAASRLGRRPATALDLGCGHGFHAIAMAKLGIEVTGIDNCAEFLEVAAKTAQADRASATFTLADARDFAKEAGHFDLVLAAYTSVIGYLQPSETRALLQSLHLIVQPSGVLIIEAASQWYVDRLTTSLIRTPTGEVIRHTYRKGRRTVFCFEDRQNMSESATEVEVFTVEQLRRMLTEGGFSDIEFCGSLDGEPYAEGVSERVVAVARP